MITCLFSCDGCGLVNSPVKMSPRVEGEDILEWMEKLTEKISEQHLFLSPVCNSRKMKEVKIPLPKEDGAWIGKQP